MIKRIGKGMISVLKAVFIPKKKCCQEHQNKIKND